MGHSCKLCDCANDDVLLVEILIFPILHLSILIQILVYTLYTTSINIKDVYNNVHIMFALVSCVI